MAELWNFQKIHNKITQKLLQMRMIKKYLKKDIYITQKERGKFIDNVRLI